ncbi:MAG: PDZ domain-containing protein, partial [Gemmataceae bacterium]
RGGSYANIHAADPRSDLAVLKLINSNHRLEPVPLGKASAIQRGSCIMAMTFPFTGGFRDGQASVARGLISNIRRWIPRKRNAKLLRPAEVLLQTDIRLGIGGSGGPIIDLHGNFVALTTARGGLSSQAVPGGFAIPMTSGNRAVIAKLKRGEEVEYGFLGISFLPSARKTNGVRITYVTPGSPADKAGLVAKNAILEVNSAPVTHSDELLVTLSRLFADQPVRLTVQKADTAKRQILRVKLAMAFPVGMVIATTVKRPFFRGLRVDHTSTLVRPDRSDLPYNKIPDGVLVTEVQPGTPAGKVLRGTGDVILAVNGHKVRNPTEFYHAVEKARGVIGLTVMPTNPREEPPTLQLPAE